MKKNHGASPKRTITTSNTDYKNIIGITSKIAWCENSINSTSFYLSSTEILKNFAWFHKFYNGNRIGYPKSKQPMFVPLGLFNHLTI